MKSSSAEQPGMSRTCTPKPICFLGFGKLGSAVGFGVLAGSGKERVSAPPTIYACVTREASKRDIEDRFKDVKGHLRVFIGEDEHKRAIAQCDVVVLATKPWVGIPLLEKFRECLNGKTLISLMAGSNIETLKRCSSPSTPTVIRVMPNTPSQIGCGMSVIAHDGSRPDMVEFARELMSKVGRVAILDTEIQMDAATALAGSGPAFVAMFVDAMIQGGLSMGLPRALARELAIQSTVGTARMLQDGEHPAVLKDNVETPGGCTVYGTLALEEGNFRSTVSKAIQACTRRAKQLGDSP